MREFDEMKLARVIDACGGVDGRVKLQKIVYLLKAMGYDLPFDDFWIRHYGPYSRAVACSADSLTSAGFVEESQAGLPIMNADGEQAKQYSYKVRESIKPLLKQHFDLPAPEGKPTIEEVASALRSLDRAPLEVAATKLFLEREDGLAGEKLDAELRRLKGHLAGHFTKADAWLAEWKQKAWL
jgi:uncharacterized protein YwgA